MNIENNFNRIARLIILGIEKFENLPIGFFSWWLTFLCFMYIRFFIENFATGLNTLRLEAALFFFINFPVVFLLSFLGFISINRVLTGERIERISRLSLFMFPMILLPVIANLLALKGGYTLFFYRNLEYANFFEIIEKFFAFLFFGKYGLLNFGQLSPCWGNLCQAFGPESNTYYGLRLELLLVIYFNSAYVFFKTRKISKTLLAVFLGYLFVFFITHFPDFFPGIINRVAYFSSHMPATLSRLFSYDAAMSSLNLLFCVPLALHWFYSYDKKKFFAVVKNIRFPRVGLYLGAFFCGLYLARPDLGFNQTDWLIIFNALMAIIFSWLVAVGSNDLADQDGDKLSNSSRPLPAGVLKADEVRQLNIFFRIVSFTFAFLAGFAFFVTIVTRAAIAYLYSNYPYRLKRFPILSTFCLAVSTLLGVLGGYLLSLEKTIYDFPNQIIFLILLTFTLSMNVIHIKDYEGDKHSGVWTLPVLFGLEKGKLITAILSALSFFVPVWIYPEFFKTLIVPALFSGILAFYLVNRKYFVEKYVLLLYYAYTVLIVSVIF